jgi:hypothetical protein
LACAAKLGEARLPKGTDLTGWQDLLPVTPQQPSVQKAAEALFPPLLKDDLVCGGAIVVVV